MREDDDTRPEIPSRKTPTPAEWLARLEEEPDRYRELVEREGLAGAAHQLATWRRAAAGYALPVPNRSDVLAAARTLRTRCGLDRIPSGRALANECRKAGLRVL